MTEISKEIIRTSEQDWITKALNCYKSKLPFQFIDDADLGIQQKDLISAVALIRAARNKVGITANKIGIILTGLGMSGLGIGLVLIAVFDPEPTSKLGILLAGGVVLALSGSLTILRALGVKFRVIAGVGGFEVHPD
jgi:hypothetical protein